MTLRPFRYFLWEPAFTCGMWDSQSTHENLLSLLEDAWTRHYWYNIKHPERLRALVSRTYRPDFLYSFSSSCAFIITFQMKLFIRLNFSLLMVICFLFLVSNLFYVNSVFCTLLTPDDSIFRRVFLPKKQTVTIRGLLDLAGTGFEWAMAG